MPILGPATVIAAKVSRSPSNALRVQLASQGAELANARQRGGAAVLFGFKNGGKAEYTLSDAAGDELRIAVAGTTTITRGDQLVGKIVPADGAARLEDSNGTVLAAIRPHTGFKADNAWHHPIVSPAGGEFGVLTLMRAHTSWRDVDAEIMEWLCDYNVTKLKAPSFGALLQLHAPVAAEVGDIFAAACVDFSVLPRGYIAAT